MDFDERQKTLANLRAIAEESMRVADVARNTIPILDNLDMEFERKTELNGIDITFLFLRQHYNVLAGIF